MRWLGGRLGAHPDAPQRLASGGLTKWRLRRVLTYIDQHICESITLATLAEVAGLSKMYFAAQFRAATGCRPHECILRKRIERAQQMLRDTAEPLVSIALTVGFQSHAHFSTVFKRFVGLSPYQWRAANRDLPGAVQHTHSGALVHERNKDLEGVAEDLRRQTERVCCSLNRSHWRTRMRSLMAAHRLEVVCACRRADGTGQSLQGRDRQDRAR